MSVDTVSNSSLKVSNLDNSIIASLKQAMKQDKNNSFSEKEKKMILTVAQGEINKQYDNITDAQTRNFTFQGQLDTYKLLDEHLETRIGNPIISAVTVEEKVTKINCVFKKAITADN